MVLLSADLVFTAALLVNLGALFLGFLAGVPALAIAEFVEEDLPVTGLPPAKGLEAAFATIDLAFDLALPLALVVAGTFVF